MGVSWQLCTELACGLGSSTPFWFARVIVKFLNEFLAFEKK